MRQWHRHRHVHFWHRGHKEWELWEGPGKHQQWRVKGETGGGVMRMTSDMALLEDESYLET